jgi:hypothetical protein
MIAQPLREFSMALRPVFIDIFFLPSRLLGLCTYLSQPAHSGFRIYYHLRHCVTSLLNSNGKRVIPYYPSEQAPSL